MIGATDQAHVEGRQRLATGMKMRRFTRRSNMGLELSACGFLHLAGAAERKDFNVPQMFDWIFFAIMLPPPLYLLWDLRKHR